MEFLTVGLFVLALSGTPQAQPAETQGTTAATQTADSQEPSGGSRAAELLARRRARLAEVEPAKRSKTVEVLTTAENDGFDQLVTFQIRHFRIGFGKISPVSGATPAVQYERPRIGSSPLTFRASGAYSLRGYQAYDAQLGIFDTPAPYDFMGDAFLGAPFDFDNRSQAPLADFLYLDVHSRRFPEELFYGIGTDSASQRTDFLLEESAVDLVAGYQFTRWLGVQARGSYVAVETGPGEDDRFPNTGDLFAPEQAPGFGESTDFAHFDAGVYLGWLGDPNLPAGQVGLRVARFDEAGGDRYRFTRVSVDARGFLPLGSRQRTLAARFYASSDRADAGSMVPFYLMKTLGGHDTLRGYRDFRFRDENLLYMSAEYRWEAAAGIDLALFYDTGKVFADRDDFSFDGLKHTWGVGIRGKSMRRVVFRLDIGRSEEGTRLYVAFGPSF